MVKNSKKWQKIRRKKGEKRENGKNEKKGEMVKKCKKGKNEKKEKMVKK